MQPGPTGLGAVALRLFLDVGEGALVAVVCGDLAVQACLEDLNDVDSDEAKGWGRIVRRAEDDEMTVVPVVRTAANAQLTASRSTHPKVYKAAFIITGNMYILSCQTTGKQGGTSWAPPRMQRRIQEFVSSASKDASVDLPSTRYVVLHPALDARGRFYCAQRSLSSYTPPFLRRVLFGFGEPRREHIEVCLEFLEGQLLCRDAEHVHEFLWKMKDEKGAMISHRMQPKGIQHAAFNSSHSTR